MTEALNMSYAFKDIYDSEMYSINAGSLAQVGYAFLGTICIAAAPIAAAAGQGWAAVAFVGTGIYLFGNI